MRPALREAAAKTSTDASERDRGGNAVSTLERFVVGGMKQAIDAGVDQRVCVDLDDRLGTV